MIDPAAHVGLAYHVAQRMARRLSVPADELLADAWLGLAAAAERYDGSTAFSTFAVPRIRGAILDAMRNDKGRKHRKVHALPAIPLDTPIGVSGDVTVADVLGDGLPCELSQLVEEEQRVLVRAALEWLSPRQRDVVVGRFWHGEQQVDIAVRLGVSKSRVNQVMARALVVLREYLTNQRPSAPTERGWSLAARAAQSERMRAVWARRRAA